MYALKYKKQYFKNLFHPTYVSKIAHTWQKNNKQNETYTLSDNGAKDA